MSQNPTIQKKSSGIDFTKTIRNDTYASHAQALRTLPLQLAQDWGMSRSK